MSDNKHPKLKPGADVPGDDAKYNPGIGSSKGMFATGADPEIIAGENTVEGDVENDTTPQGGVDPRQVGRTNK